MTLYSLPLVRRPKNRCLWVLFWAPYVGIYEVINRFPIFSPQPLPMSVADTAVPFVPELLPLYVAYIPFFWWTGIRSESDEAFSAFLYATYLQLAVCSAIWILFPVTLPRELFYAGPAFNWADTFWRWFDAPNNCFPSLHAANCLLFLQLNWSRRGRYTHSLLALGILASTVLVKQHYVADLVAGAAVYGLTAGLMYRASIQTTQRGESIVSPRSGEPLLSDA